MSWTCSRNHALGYSTPPQPYTHPNLKALPPTSLAQQMYRTPPHTAMGSPIISRAITVTWQPGEYTFYGVHSCSMHKKVSVKQIYLPAKILTGNNVTSVGCCTYYFFSDKYLTQLNWNMNCFYNSQYSCTTILASHPKMLVWWLFILHISRQSHQIPHYAHLLSLTDNYRLNGQLENSFYTNAVISCLTHTPEK